MALPSLDNLQDKGQIQEIVADIATAVFKSAKVSIESAAKAVVPSVPEMVDEVIDDLKSGSIQKFNLAMDKLDKLVRTLGIDLKQYNRELANFAARREEKIIKSEEKIQLLREKNIIAEIEKSGDIKILSNRDIENKKVNLKLLERNIANLEKAIEKDRKLLQENNKLKTTAQANKKEEVKQNVLKLDDMKKQRDVEKQVLGERGEQQPGIFQRGSEGIGNFVEEYVPQPIADIGSAMVEGFMAPINAVKDLGRSFGQLLKPLKMLKPLFTGLLGNLKKFALGLKASVLAFLPYLAISGLLILALGGLYLMIKKAKEFFNLDDGGEGGAGDIAAEAAGVGIGEDTVAEEGDMSSKMQRRNFVINQGTENAEIIQPSDPRYDKLYEEKYGKPAPKQGQVYNSETGKTEILPLTSDGELIKSGNFMKNRSAENLKSPDNLKPVEKTENTGNANVNTVSQVSNVSNQSFSSPGLGSPHNRDFEKFVMDFN